MNPVTKTEDISRRLVDARLSAQPLPDFPGRLPGSLERAYAIQARSIERWPDTVAGWKVARLSAGDRERFSAERLVGPVFRSSICKSEPGSYVTMPIYDGGFAAIEAEIILELGSDVLPQRRDYTDDALIEFVSAAYCGAEIASSPMAVVNDRGATSVIADLGNNAGVIVGPELRDWQTLAAASLTVEVTVDDSVVGKTTVGSITRDPLEAFRFLVNHCARHDTVLPSGTIISSGALTGVHEVQITSVSHIDFGGYGSIGVVYKPITGQQ